MRYTHTLRHCCNTTNAPGSKHIHNDIAVTQQAVYTYITTLLQHNRRYTHTLRHCCNTTAQAVYTYITTLLQHNGAGNIHIHYDIAATQRRRRYTHTLRHCCNTTNAQCV
ncbi:hypothetical protein DPMN_130257 [Dreissena polymorpha]|uniref:Uncharacterized protein n=1 Tax=Dreissena polymorpha TaxID=45954 RepID=A0A9D4JZ15_DREPO|nr:hypothetical protein DPMN_130257 [Dreissena polymorpha]